MISNLPPGVTEDDIEINECIECGVDIGGPFDEADLCHRCACAYEKADDDEDRERD